MHHLSNTKMGHGYDTYIVRHDSTPPQTWEASMCTKLEEGALEINVEMILFGNFNHSTCSQSNRKSAWIQHFRVSLDGPTHSSGKWEVALNLEAHPWTPADLVKMETMIPKSCSGPHQKLGHQCTAEAQETIRTSEIWMYWLSIGLGFPLFILVNIGVYFMSPLESIII